MITVVDILLEACLFTVDLKILEMANIEWNFHPPFYIHPSESSYQMLADVPLTGDNYHSWSREVRRSLGSKNKLCFILDDTGIEKAKLGDNMYDVW